MKHASYRENFVEPTFPCIADSQSQQMRCKFYESANPGDDDWACKYCAEDEQCECENACKEALKLYIAQTDY